MEQVDENRSIAVYWSIALLFTLILLQNSPGFSPRSPPLTSIVFILFPFLLQAISRRETARLEDSASGSWSG